MAGTVKWSNSANTMIPLCQFSFAPGALAGFSLPSPQFKFADLTAAQYKHYSGSNTLFDPLTSLQRGRLHDFPYESAYDLLQIGWPSESLYDKKMKTIWRTNRHTKPHTIGIGAFFLIGNCLIFRETIISPFP
jgi:hypothetical protein